MDPHGTSGFRAGVVARARFIEDLVAEQAGHGVTQYVILGAGLDTFAQRQPARDEGFRDARNVPLTDLTPRYFAGRTDGLRPVTGEDILLATT
jgi:hypothetical protein